MKYSSMIWALALGIACIHCSSSETGTTNGTNTPGSSGSSGDDGSSGGTPDEGSGTPDASSNGPSFASIQTSIFSASCNGNMCHGSGARGGLKLTDKATSCANLVDVAAEDSMQNAECPTGGASSAGMKRVVPGDPAASFLYLKLLGSSDCISVDGKSAGERMPKGAPALSAAKIATIEQWIKAGASCD